MRTEVQPVAAAGMPAAPAPPRCPAGHVFDEDNTAKWRRSGRTCRACRRAYQRRIRDLQAELLALRRAEVAR